MSDKKWYRVVVSEVCSVKAEYEVEAGDEAEAMDLVGCGMGEFIHQQIMEVMDEEVVDAYEVG